MRGWFCLNANRIDASLWIKIKQKGGVVMKTYIGRTIGVIVLFAMLASNAWAAGAGPGGIDILHVPMSWCIVDGSPAQASPNLAGDTNTDAIIWRRHERPTDNIFIPQTGISLRSAINSIWGSWSFPTISDQDTSNVCGAFECVTESDTRGEDVNVAAIAVEFNDLINACRMEYAAIGKAGIGITAVSLGLYHNGDPEYIGIIGWGGCVEDATGNCSVPYDGLIAVVDNKYLHPSSPNRTWPGNNDKTGWAYISTDPFDQLVGHEAGHALSLPHRNDSTAALMFPSQQDNNMDGLTDNINLNGTEVAALRANAMNVPGLEIDPPGEFNPGRFQAHHQPDMDRRNPNLPGHLDLASVRATWDFEKKQGKLEAYLNGMVPEKIFDLWFLVDEDNDPDTGAQLPELEKLLPGDPRIQGVEALAQVVVRSGELIHKAWLWQDGSLVENPNIIRPELLTMRLEPHISPFALQSDQVVLQKPPPPADLHNIVGIIAPMYYVVPDKLFGVQVLTAADGEIFDYLNDQEPTMFEVTAPTFPHCFVNGDAQVGEVVEVTYDGLKPFAGKPLHALLGPIKVAEDTVGDDGTGMVKLPIPEHTRPGPHLVTIGPDGAALTADCTVNVFDEFACVGDLDGDGDVDGRDVALMALDFGLTDCRVKEIAP
jgi:hypothetical protein